MRNIIITTIAFIVSAILFWYVSEPIEVYCLGIATITLFMRIVVAVLVSLRDLEREFNETVDSEHRNPPLS
jgi:Flp pilus assembly protein TadB